MPVPAKRRSSSKGRRNRSHDALKKIGLTKCSKCGKAIEPHNACQFCGTFKGEAVLKVKSRVKTEKK